MIFREAHISDVDAIMKVRLSVKENVLEDPERVRPEDCVEYLNHRGKGWVCEIEQQIVGFTIVDLVERKVWALFLHPDFERKGIGRKLHQLMLDWYFAQTDEGIWLGTDPKTRAAGFYRMAGWREVGLRENGELKFEMKKSDWGQ